MYVYVHNTYVYTKKSWMDERDLQSDIIGSLTRGFVWSRLIDDCQRPSKIDSSFPTVTRNCNTTPINTYRKCAGGLTIDEIIVDVPKNSAFSRKQFTSRRPSANRLLPQRRCSNIERHTYVRIRIYLTYLIGCCK